MLDEIIVRLNELKRNRQGDWIHTKYGFSISYDKMIRLAKEAGISEYRMRPDEDYLIISIFNGRISSIHYDKFTNLNFEEEDVNDRTGE